MEKKYRYIFAIMSCLFSFSAFAVSTLYQTHLLVSDGLTPADHKDTNLVNPWGIAFGPTSYAWIANNGTGTSTIYDGSGNPQPIVVTIASSKNNKVGTPTGIIFNGTRNWMIGTGDQASPATFLFAAEDGTISGWAESVNPTKTVIAVDHSSSGASYKGMTTGANGYNSYLYVTNFHDNKIEVYDGDFKPVTLPGNFTDPDLPQGFAPFGIQNINGDIFVTYGLQNAKKDDAVKGCGLGFVSAYDADGHFIRRIASAGYLNAPWGLALAPSSFGSLSNHLLIGNFGDGHIVAVDLIHNNKLSFLKGGNDKPITIDGLWSLSFGNGLNQQPTNTLFFTAGPGDENHGLFGTITPI